MDYADTFGIISRHNGINSLVAELRRVQRDPAARAAQTVRCTQGRNAPGARASKVALHELAPMRGLKLAKLRREIKAGLDDIAAGRTVDGGKAFAALRNRLKLRPAADDA